MTQANSPEQKFEKNIPVKKRFSLQSDGAAWLFGLLAATLLMVLLEIVSGLRYVGNDDTPILRAFMGFEGGRPASYHMIIHTGLAWLLHGLALIGPGIAWYSIFQLVCLWFSSVVILKSMVQCAVRRKLPVWVGMAFGLGFLAVFGTFLLSRISFTTTGVLLGAAAVAQLISMDWESGTKRKILRGMLLSIVLLIACYSLRDVGVLPPLAFWLVTLCWIFFTHFSPFSAQQKGIFRRSPRALFTGLGICLVSLALLIGVRAAEVKLLHLEDYLRWHESRVQLFDYTNFYDNTPPETREQLGWSEAKFKLVANWFFMDESITPEVFDTLYAAQMANVDTSFPAKTAASVTMVRQFFEWTPFLYWGGILLLTAGAAASLFFLLWHPGKRWMALLAPVGILLCYALLFYLAFEGRLPLRAGLSAIVPAAIFLMMLLLHSLPPIQGKKPAALWLPILVGCACLVLAVFSVQGVIPLVSRETDPEQLLRDESIPADLITLAQENEDVLIIYDTSLVSDNRLFPDLSEGIPANLMFWGGYPAHSPGWLYQLEQFDIDGSAMTAQDFMRENVVVASSDGAPWISLTAHLQENSEGSVEWDFYADYGFVGLFQYTEYEYEEE